MKRENQVFSIMPIMLIMIVLIYSTLIFLLYNKMSHELKSLKHENKQLKNEVQQISLGFVVTFRVPLILCTKLG